MVTKHLYDFATPGGGGYPNDDINDHQAFLDAAAFFQARNGYGTLILENGEYIMGVQQFRNVNDPLPGPGWNIEGYPAGVSPQCKSLIAWQNGFALNGCSNFTISGGSSTRVRYRDCLYYGTFLRDSLTDVVSSAVGYPAGASRCVTCNDTLILPQHLNIPLLHAAVGVMFTFTHCDSITIRNVELHGNIDAAILGGKIHPDGMQTAHDGIILNESSACLLEYVHAHHFGRDGLMIMSEFDEDSTTVYMEQHPGLTLVEDIADAQEPQWRRTVLFSNQVNYSRFNWNGRQGLSWTGCSGLMVEDCEFNYNGAGRMSSLPGAGLDIEGGGGPMRVRYGVFNQCRFLHNQGAGITSETGPCYGQQDFRFNGCVVKAGENADAIWANTRGLKFIDCQIFGRVDRLFEQAEDIPYDPEHNLVFHRTDFREEDEQWSYLFWDTANWENNCAAGPHKLDLVAPNGQRARILFDSCGFYTNCRGTLRLLGRALTDVFPYCNGGLGPYSGSDTVQDARFVVAKNCYFKNTGRLRCSTTTNLIAVDRTTLSNFRIDVPDAVREAWNAGDTYTTEFGLTSWATPSCLLTNFCSDVDTTYTTYDEFPPCRPFYSDGVSSWAFCNQWCPGKLEKAC